MSKQTTAINHMDFTSLSSPVLTRAHARARELRLSFPEYVNRLISQDVKQPTADPWGPVPKHVNERWDKEIKQFESENKRNPRPAAKNADELIRLLDEEAAQLTTHERN